MVAGEDKLLGTLEDGDPAHCFERLGGFVDDQYVKFGIE